MSDILAQVDRVEAHALRPGDILAVYLAEANPEQAKVELVQRLVTEALRERDLDNVVFIFAGGIRLEVLRPEDEAPTPIRAEPLL